MPRHLLILEGPERGQAIRLQSGRAVTLGRAHAAELRLLDPEVSRMHCRLEIGDEALGVRDLGSAAGTFINDQRVQEGQLALGDTLWRAEKWLGRAQPAFRAPGLIRQVWVGLDRVYLKMPSGAVVAVHPVSGAPLGLTARSLSR